jgi:hypothetical protein
VDEYELFGKVMFPKSKQGPHGMKILTTARVLLGDINDDWTAYSIYVENGEYYSEQERLAVEIDEAWTYFRVWVHNVKFEEVVQHLLDSLDSGPIGKSLGSPYLQ